MRPCLCPSFVRLLALLAALPMATAFRAMAEQPASNSGVPAQPDARQRASVAEAYGNLPLSFEASFEAGRAATPGQPDANVRFLARGAGYGLFLTDKGAVLTLSQRTSDPKAKRTDTVGMELAGSNTKAAVRGLDQLPGTVNYFVGSDPSKWRSGVFTFGKVSYQDVYPGVDLVYYGNQSQLEYDFVVAPGASAAPIRLRFTGAETVRIDADGALVIGGSHGSIDFHKPAVYQEKDGRRQPVEGDFRLLSDKTVGFRLGAYDHAKPLVIDPILQYSTYLGGTNGGSFGGDFVGAIAVDKAGDAYLTGQADSSNFPVTDKSSNTSGGTDIFVTKLNSTGTGLIYSTYLGGSLSGGGFGIAVDSYGDAYVTGTASAGDFPVTPNAFQTVKPGYGAAAFVTKLNSSGTALVYSTLITGSEFDGGAAIAVNSSGDAYVAGYANSPDFPITSGAYQTVNNAPHSGGNGFISKLNAAGSALLYSTFLGGSGPDFVSGLAVSSSGVAYVTGTAHSSNFPTTPGSFQSAPGFPAGYGGCNAFVAALKSTGTALLYSTYLGGNYADRGLGIAVDGSGDAYVTGLALSSNFPVTAGAFETAMGSASGYGFVTKLNPSGAGLVYSTFLGGNATSLGAEDYGTAITLDPYGDAYVTGVANSSNFPVTANAFQATDPGSKNAWVSELNQSGSGLVYSTYLGGSNYEYGNGVAVDGNGGIYVAGQTFSSDFPTTSNAFLPVDPVGTSGDSSGFIVKLEAGGAPATLTAPASGTKVPGSETFSWTAGKEVTAYQLTIGSTAGASDLYNSGETTALSSTVTGLPTNGGTLFVTLFSVIGGVSTSNAYTFIASGTPAKAVLTAPTPGTKLSGSSATFTWTAGTGVTSYQLLLGSKAGAGDLFNSGATSSLSASVTGLPIGGGTVFATLYSLIDRNNVSNAYTYTAAGTPAKAVLTSPAPGSTLPATGATFSWSAGTGVTSYELLLGTKSGAKDLYYSGVTYNRSATVTSIPATGGTVFATLYSLIDGNYQGNAYTFLASGTPAPAVLTTPTPGTQFNTSSVTFDWTAGTGVTSYQLKLGTKAGASNLYNSNVTTALTVTVTGLPANGSTIYATLSSLIDGAYKSNASTYTASNAPQEAVLYSFTRDVTGSTDGAYPAGNLAMDSGGNIYGTTEQGGTDNGGTVFKVTPSGAESVLYRFQQKTRDGVFPSGGVVLDGQGNIYGTTYFGGAYNAGTVFKLTPQGTETVLYTFGGFQGDGALPWAGLILDAQGNLYGTTSYGGSSNSGTVFKITPGGKETVLYSFSGGADGSMPSCGSLAMDPAGNLFGTTEAGGAFTYGTVFKVAPDGTETVLHNFNEDGVDGHEPIGGVVLDAQGNLYGTTSAGGASNAGGIVYKLTPSGTETVLYNFDIVAPQSASAFGAPATNLSLDKAGNLYGTAPLGPPGTGGVAFRLAPSGVMTLLHNFDFNSEDGTSPSGPLLLDGKGNLYGVTTFGGTITNIDDGAVYEIPASN